MLKKRFTWRRWLWNSVCDDCGHSNWTNFKPVTFDKAIATSIADPHRLEHGGRSINNAYSANFEYNKQQKIKEIEEYNKMLEVTKKCKCDCHTSVQE